jgi:acetylglutamate kinase
MNGKQMLKILANCSGIPGGYVKGPVVTTKTEAGAVEMALTAKIDAEKREILEPLSYRPKDAAKILGVSFHTLERWRRYKSGPVYVKHDGIILYTRQALLLWLRQNTVLTSDQLDFWAPRAKKSTKK